MASYTRDGIDMCDIREWRRMERATKIMDLKSAYLQIYVDRKLWQYQLVEYKSQIYCLTRLGFGLSFTPKIMMTVLKTVLAKDYKVKRATNSYIDDILVEEVEVTVEKVRDYVSTYGLTAKLLVNGNRVALKLKLWRDKAGKLVFGRGNEIPEISDGLTKRELFFCVRKVDWSLPHSWIATDCMQFY